MPSTPSPRTPRDRVRRGIALLVAVLVIPAAAAACSAIDKPGSVAVVDGTTISQADVATAATQINGSGLLQQPLSEASVGQWLLLSKFVLPVVGASKSWTPDTSFVNALAKISNPTPATTDVLKTIVAVQTGLDANDQAAMLTAMRAAKVQLNPAFGNWDPTSQSLISNDPPTWIAPTPTS